MQQILNEVESYPKSIQITIRNCTKDWTLNIWEFSTRWQES